LIGKSKVAGILIENSSSSNLLDSSIVGVGLNVNQQEFGMLEATSLQNTAYENFDLMEVLALFLENFDRYFHLLKTKTNHSIREEYLSVMYLLNQPAYYLYRNKRIYAQVIGITNYGMLEMLNLETKIVFTCDIKEIVYL